MRALLHLEVPDNWHILGHHGNMAGKMDLKKKPIMLTLKVLVATIDAQWEGMGDVGSARYEPALLPPCPTIRVLSYSN